MEHNTFDMRGTEGTAALYLDDANLRSVTIKDNLIAGGGYSLFIRWSSGAKWAVSGTLRGLIFAKAP